MSPLFEIRRSSSAGSLSVGACFYYNGACAADALLLNIKLGAGTGSCILSRAREGGGAEIDAQLRRQQTDGYGYSW